MSRAWQDAVTELVSTGLTQHQLGLLLEVVTAVTRHVTDDVTRHASSRSAAAIRAARYRRNRNIRNELAKANDAAKAVTERRDASRDGVTERCDLLSSSEVTVRERGSREVRATASVVEGRKRGTRMVPGAQIPPDDLQFARDAGMTAERAAQAWAEFVDYWIGVPGQRGTKLDWSATWRNRVRAIIGSNGASNGHRGPRPLQDDSKSISRAAERLAELAERGEFSFGRRPSLLPEDDARPVQLLSKG